MYNGKSKCKVEWQGDNGTALMDKGLIPLPKCKASSKSRKVSSGMSGN